MIPVIWWTVEGNGRCCWDQHVVDWLAPPPIFYNLNQHAPRPDISGAVVVVPARFNTSDEHLAKLNAFLAPLSWVVLLLTSDEESLFPWHRVQHPNIRIWVQYAHPERHKNPSLRYFPIGAPDLSAAGSFIASRPQTIDVWFRGQKNHLRRDQAVAAFVDTPNSSVLPTPGFAQGIDRNSYLEELSRAKIAICPSGPAHPDSFRCWEALELGVIPVVDEGPIPDPEGRAVTTFPRFGFWQMVFGEKGPIFPIVSDWTGAGLGEWLPRALLNEWPDANNHVFAWYQGYKRNLRRQLLDDVAQLGNYLPGSVDSNITVLLPTSPTPNNPDFSHLDITIESITSRLPNSEILLMIDGIRPEQSHRTDDYREYIRRVLFSANHHWSNVTPYLYEEHLHQAEMTRRTLAHVDTDYILFVEHDTPLHGDIPFGEWMDLVASSEYDVVRTYHETVLQPEHMHLMDEQYGDYLVTHQWSQRPHFASTDWYASMLNKWFSEDARTFIEDRIHGPAQEFPDEFRMALYAPSGNIQRSTHLDARGTEPKYEMSW